MKKFSIFLLGIGLFFSCADPKQESNDQNGDQDSLSSVAAEPDTDFGQKVFYPIPSPEQMFGFINEVGVSYSKELIHQPELAKQYTEPTKLALNFGVYTADLAYAAAYKDIETTSSLYQVVSEVAEEMNIAQMMSEVLMKQVKDNLQNRDSLSAIAGKAYYDAVGYLEQSQMEGKLALMSVGGWIESLYITLSSIQDFQEDSPTAQRIADQKITFGNLYTYLKDHESERGVKEAISELQAVRSVFASLPETKVAKRSKSKDGLKMVLSSGRRISIDQKQFEALKIAIADSRAGIISISDPVQ